jgi:DNA polymerase III subunit gamma/tau
MSQALYRKWRPQKWDEVVSQEHIVQTLRNAVVSNRVAHAYIFSGPRGTGKTTAARLLAKAVNCLNDDPATRPCNECAHCVAVNENRFLDLIEIDAASNTSVDDVRDLRDKINFSPSQGKYKIYIIDEVHMLSTAAFNALLKTLEEPPPHAIFILATTEIHKIPATVLSRCQRHEFRRLPVAEITGRLEDICKSENLQADPEALSVIARQSAGGMRDAISLLDQLASTGGQITVALAQTVLGTATSETVLALIDAIKAADAATGMQSIHSALDGGTDARALARQIVDTLRAVMLFQMGNGKQMEAPAEVRARMEQYAQAFTALQVLSMVKVFNNAATDLRGGWQPALPLELALAEVLEQPAESMSQPAVSQQRSVEPARIEKAPARADRVAPKTVTDAKNISGSSARGGGLAAGSNLEMGTKPQTVEKTAAAISEGISLDQVAKAWKQIRLIIKPQSPSLDGLLNSCKLLEVKEGVLVLGFASELLRSKADTPEQMDVTCKAIGEVLGKEMPVRCVVTNAKQTAPANVKADGMVAAALKAGGEIVDIQE